MKLLARREQYIGKYIALTQFFFFLLICIILYRSRDLSFQNYFGNIPTLIIIIIVFGMAPLIQSAGNKHIRYEIILDFVIIIVYIGFVAYLLMKEAEALFKVSLLMPVIVMSLKYGKKMASIAALLSIISLLLVSYLKNFDTIDADIMFSGIIILLAWLLGNMTETEYVIRMELERLATYDGLTDIYNHRSFQNIIDRELEKAKKENSRVSLILLDIDYFKYYNDAYGHQEGDKILKQLAQLLVDTVGEQGYCARYGGEEFGVILPKHDIEQGKEMGERIRFMIENHHFPGGNIFPKGKLTASIGLAEYPLNADSKEKLIKKADEALYRAKFVSKNRVESYYSVFDEISFFLKKEEKELFNSISAFTMVINAKDRYTYGHSLRVMDMAKRLALRLEVKAERIQEITFGALLHDIGKIEISREVLNKPGKLNEHEWDILRQHPVWGADIIDPLKSLYGVKEIILYHHENYDGTGYPEGVSGDNIPFGARLLRIVDSYDALTTDRPYKSAMSLEQALEELDRYDGVHYDSVMLKAFKEMMRETPEA